MKRAALLLLFALLAAAGERRPGWVGLGFTAHRDRGEQWLIVRFVAPDSPAARAGLGSTM